MENDIIKKFINTDYKLLEKELEELSKKDELRLEVDQGLDQTLRDLEIISAKIPQKKHKSFLINVLTMQWMRLWDILDLRR